MQSKHECHVFPYHKTTRHCIFSLLCAKMPPKASPFLEGYVLALSDVGFSFSRIIAQCKIRGISVSKAGVHAICSRDKTNPTEGSRSQQVQRKKHPTPKRSAEVVRKVKAAVQVENPRTQRSISAAVGVSQRTVGRIIHENLH